MDELKNINLKIKYLIRINIMKNFLTKKICFMAVIWAMVISIFASSSHADCFMHPMGSLDSDDIHNIIDISVDIRGSFKNYF